jgi:Zn-dependent protease
VSEQTIFALMAAGITILVAFPVHEFSHAWAAYRLGDSTARYMGRLTLDPRAHFDPLGGLVLIASVFIGFFIGWAKPTPVNPYNLQYGRRGESIVAGAGPISNLFLASVVAIPLRVIWGDPQLLQGVVTSLPATVLHNVAWYFVAINALLFVFNLLPIPPLDGWKVLLGLVNARLSYSLRQFEQYAIFLLLGLLLLGGRVLGPLLNAVIGFFVANAIPLPLGL